MCVSRVRGGWGLGTYILTTLMFVSRNLWRQFWMHDSSVLSSLLEVILPWTHFLKHMSVKLWIAIGISGRWTGRCRGGVPTYSFEPWTWRSRTRSIAWSPFGSWDQGSGGPVGQFRAFYLRLSVLKTLIRLRKLKIWPSQRPPGAPPRAATARGNYQLILIDHQLDWRVLYYIAI